MAFLTRRKMLNLVGDSSVTPATLTQTKQLLLASFAQSILPVIVSIPMLGIFTINSSAAADSVASDSTVYMSSITQAIVPLLDPILALSLIRPYRAVVMKAFWKKSNQ